VKRFGIVNYDVISDPELSIQAKGLYSTLSLYANNKRECYPSISTLADLNNISQRQVDRLIRELKDKKYIIRTGRVITLV
jgi:DNA-binding IscR family transcriptional regulator|tara:strand:+ start:344 stop:583 length:240 start_codon:yes stop_codon:yes gene_type:complete